MGAAAAVTGEIVDAIDAERRAASESRADVLRAITRAEGFVDGSAALGDDDRHRVFVALRLAGDQIVEDRQQVAEAARLAEPYAVARAERAEAQRDAIEARVGVDRCRAGLSIVAELASDLARLAILGELVTDGRVEHDAAEISSGAELLVARFLAKQNPHATSDPIVDDLVAKLEPLGEVSTDADEYDPREARAK